MPITPLDAITFANQNMQVVASKQNDYRNRLDQQKYAAVERLTKGEMQVAGVGELKEDQKIDAEREHNKERAEEETGEKAKETQIKQALNKKDKTEDKEELDAPYRILDIKV